MFQRPLSSALLLLAGFATVSPVRALGFGRVPESIPFAQPLDLSVPVQLGGAAMPPPGCLQGQVLLGEHRLPPSSLQMQMEGSGEDARVRIRSAVVVQEPTVTVQLTLGCSGGAVSRQFVFFADVVPQRAGADAVPAAVAALGAERPRPAPSPRIHTPEAGAAPPPPRAKPEPPHAPSVGLSPALAPAPTPAPTLATPSADEAALSAAWQMAAAAQAAASAAEQRLAVAQADLERLRAQAEAQRALVAELRAQQATPSDPSRVQAALIAFVVSLGLVALWLVWRIRGARQERSVTDWQELVDFDEGVSEPFRPEPPPTWEPAAAKPLSLAAEHDPGCATDVDELIDLEQEVEFFLLLGDEHAAIDLLEAHLRHRATASPLPCLQLLQMHRRHADREAYDRVAGRLGTDAPDWADGLAPGRGLLDCPLLLAELQARWAVPAQAVGWVGRQLFSAPGPDRPGLPAYRDLLTLFIVARDLHRQADGLETDVDLLLPLADGDERVATQRTSIFDRLEPAGGAPKADSAVDVNLNEPAARS